MKQALRFGTRIGIQIINSWLRSWRRDEDFRTAVVLYLSGALALFAAIQLRSEPAQRIIDPLERALARGHLESGVPRLDPVDAMANAWLLQSALADVPPPGVEGPHGELCAAAPRFFALLLEGRLSRVHFDARTVCQLALLKRISAGQNPTDGGIGEVAAFVLGRRVTNREDVHVTRIIVPPFQFTPTTLTFIPADLGPLGPGEQLIGTYHTHPDDDLEQGVLSDVDLNFMHTGEVDFHGEIGPLWHKSPRLDWLFDIVEPVSQVSGDWNVYAHDHRRLVELWRICENEADCPLNQLRLTGSRFNLLTRYYEDR